jgi:hypothetical protein
VAIPSPESDRTSRERHQRSGILAGLGAVVGALAGAVGFLNTGRVLYLGVGCLIGALAGQAFAYLRGARWDTGSLLAAERRTNVTLGLLSAVMCAAGAVAYWRKGEAVLLVGALFFGACAGVLLLHRSKV